MSSRDEDSKQWSDLFGKSFSQTTKTSRKADDKREEELNNEKIRRSRELNVSLYETNTSTDQTNTGMRYTADASAPKSASTSSVSLSDRNALNAKLLKAQLMGNQTLVAELTLKLKQLDNGCGVDNRQQSVVSESHKDVYWTEKKTNEESMSLKEMYLRAKQSTADDESRKFVASSSRVSRRPEDEYEDMKSTKSKKRKHEDKSHKYVKYESGGTDKCRQCVDNIGRQLIITKGENTIISLTSYEPFVSGFCYILSKSHSNVSTISAEEECLLEINERKHQICKIYEKHNKSVVFMETYFKRGRNSNRHLTIECIPIKSKHESEARIFFKKAIMESETEWAMNKQLIEIKDKSVTKLIPKGLSYFWVTFGAKNIGFAHVIENEDTFSPHFGKQVIAGLLDIEPNKWLNTKHQNYEQQLQRVISFKNHWKQSFG